MHEQRWILGHNCQVKILREFSATELIGIVFARHADNRPILPLTAKELPEGKQFNLGGRVWRVLYTRMESNEAGGYLATALRMV